MHAKGILKNLGKTNLIIKPIQIPKKRNVFANFLGNK